MEFSRHRTLIPVFEELRGEHVLIRPYRLEDAETQFEAVMESARLLAALAAVCGAL